MTTNILVALKNILDNKNNKLLDIYNGHNRANNLGDALEYYIKDLFCNSLNIEKFSEKDKMYSKYLSYLGNSNNPPDFIIKNSIAVEVKKVEKLSFSDIALNSSYPKDYIYNNSTLINKSCKFCEDYLGGWSKKDMLYAIGNVVHNNLKLLWLLDGECYCADKEVYERMRKTISTGVENINGVEFAQTKELGKVHKVDPLGITNLRIRGMWSIKHPMKAFDYLVEDYNSSVRFQIYVLILKNKYDILPQDDKIKLNDYINSGLLDVENVTIKDPNNPAKLNKAIFFKASL